MWEGPEILRVELELDPNESLGAKIAANASSTVVVIDDPEDSKPIILTHKLVILLQIIC